MKETVLDLTANNGQLIDEVSRLRGVLQRIRRWGSPMVRGYIDGALGRPDRGGGVVGHDKNGEMVAQEERHD